MPDLLFRGSKREARGVFRRLAAMLAGKVPDPQGVVSGVQLAMGAAALSQIYQAFIEKSRGGVGSDGIKWAPLKRETIAYGRRTTAAERTAAGDRGGPRPLLTPAQDKLWKRVFGTRLARLRLTMGEGEAKALAAKIAWAEVKKVGGKTKLEVYGSRVVDIGRDTGRLLQSLGPGVDGPSDNPDQVFETPPGAVVVGTNVVYAPRFHAKRPLWPGETPPAWVEPIGDAGMDALQAAAGLLLAAEGRA
jgi:hypothetical protein